MRILVATASLLALAACNPRLPDSGAYADGSSSTSAVMPAAAPVSAMPLSGTTTGGSEGADIAAETSQLLGLNTPSTMPPATTTGAPLTAMAPTATVNSGASTEVVEEGAPASMSNISDEQNFTAVAERESIESDAERLAQNRAQYQVIQPTELPQRAGGSGASIVHFALATNNPKGQQMYSRSRIAAQARFDRACGKFTSQDRAQEAFLDGGGPERDRSGMDPDGDGFACYWDPAPFRAARNGAPEQVTQYVDVETGGVSQ